MEIGNISKKKLINECLIKDSIFKSFNGSEYEKYKFMCKIETDHSYGSGFFININSNKFLITCEHNLIDEKTGSKFKKIKIKFYVKNNEKKKKENREILLDRNLRIIKNFNEDAQFNSDVVSIEITESDNINDNLFLQVNTPNRIEDYKIFENSKIQIPQFLDGKHIKYSKGQIKIAQYNEFTHYASTKKGSSGSPIFLEDSFCLIGIHCARIDKKKENYGIFLNRILLSLSQIKKKEESQLIYIPNMFNYSNGNYYIGSLIEGLPSGEGVLYDQNDKKIYEGNFLNGQANGKGIFYYENGIIQYEGDWSNGLRNGFGKYYNNEGSIIYEGYFFNNQYYYSENNNNNKINKINKKNKINRNASCINKKKRLNFYYEYNNIYNDNKYNYNNQENNYDYYLNNYKNNKDNLKNVDIFNKYNIELNKNFGINNKKMNDHSGFGDIQIYYCKGEIYWKRINYYYNNQDEIKYEDNINNNNYKQIIKVENSYENDYLKCGYGLKIETKM